MKKIILFIILLTSLTAVSQTIVGTDVENRNVVLEEFTGIHCGYCPDGHAIAQAILNENPEDVFLVNVHEGSFANPGVGEPDFKTSFGTEIVSQTGMGLSFTGYPGGTVNRHNFPGMEMGEHSGITLMSRTQWANASTQILGETSYVNIAVETEINATTRQMTVHVEAYYTGDSPEATNFLNVAVLQDNTLGPQKNGGVIVPEYNHMHRLVHLITGQWGQEISTTTTGTFVDETFTYDIPLTYNDVFANLANLKIVAFISETHQEIITGGGCEPTIVDVLANDGQLINVFDIEENCLGSIIPQIQIANGGANTITSLDINYNVNEGATETYTWIGSLESFELANIELPEISFDLESSNTLNVSLATDDIEDNNTGNTMFNEVTTEAGYELITVEIKPDNYGSETTWELINKVDDSVILSGGPYTDGDNTVHSEQVAVSTNGCYQFIIYDSYGDGIDSGYGVGYYKLFSGPGMDLVINGGDFESIEKKGFITPDVFLANEELHFTSAQIFPNPTTTTINVVNAEGLNISLIDVLGREVYTKENISIEEQINVSSFKNGTYILKLSDDTVSRTEKIVIMK